MRTRAGAALFLVLAGTVRAAAGPPVEIRGTVEPDTVTIGTRFRYTVEVAAGAGVEVVVSEPAGKIGDFEVVDFGVAPASERDGKSVVTRWYTLVGYEPGHYLVPSPPVLARLPGEALAPVPPVETVVTVESLLAREEDAADIRDIAGPEPIPVDWRPYYLLAAGLAAVLALGALLFRVLNRPRHARPAPPPRPAHEVAFSELRDLKARRLVEQGAFKEYYFALSGIVRSYLERRFRVRAPEMTTEEFLLASARDGRLAGAHRRLLADFLAESDLVKFARHLPTIADSERAWAAARRFVDETAAAPAAPEERRAAG